MTDQISQGIIDHEQRLKTGVDPGLFPVELESEQL